MNNKITLGNILNMFLFISVFSLTANAQTVIFSEDFSSITTGNSTESSGSGTAWNGNENFIVDAANSKAYQAGGAVRLGTSGAIGFITTKPLDLSQGGGAFTVNFDVKGWSAAGNIKVILRDAAGTTISEQLVPYTNAMSGSTTTIGPFEPKTISFTGGVANGTIRFETLADPSGSRRAFVDNVTVTVAPMTVPLAAPVATAALNVDHDSFVADWETVEGSTGYRIDVSTASDFSTFVGIYNDLATVGTSQEVTGLTSNTTYYYRVRAKSGDETSANSNIIAVTTDCGPFTLPQITGDAFCAGSTVADLPAGNNEGYEWFATETGGSALAVTDVLIQGTYYLMQTINNCESDRIPYQVTITTVQSPVIEDNEVEVCNSGTIADITPEGSGYNWYAAATGGTALASTEALVNGTLYVSKTEGTCESERVAILVEIEIPAVPEGEAEQEFTDGETLANLDVIADEELVWYADEALTTEIPATTVLTDDTTYYAVNVDAACMSAPLAVTVNVTAGTSQFGMDGLVGYPNPVNNVFTVTFTEPINAVTVYNMLGQTVMAAEYNAASVQVNIAAYAAGTYFVKVVSGAKAQTIKVVKQ